MAILWILVITVVAFIATITLVVIGQEFHPIASVVLFAGLVYLAIVLFKKRVTRI